MLRTVGLTKSYGSRLALRDVDLEVPAGACYGLVGPNGSGKTTLLEILAGLRRPTGGKLDLAMGREAVAYCPDVAEFEPWLSALEVLEAALGLLGRRRPRPELSVILGRVGLAEVADRRVGGFSRGMTTRLNLAAALAGEPSVLLLDEPAAALDPAGRVEVLRLIADLAPATTIVLSSHDLTEVETVCDRVGILANGYLCYQGLLADLLTSSAQTRWRLTVRPPAEPTIAALRAVVWAGSVVEVEGAPGQIEFTAPDADQVEIGLPGLLAAAGARLVSTAPLRPSLEEVFLALTTPNREGAELR
jgi:ABC-2 type transport system ATP-binding protein